MRQITTCFVLSALMGTFPSNLRGQDAQPPAVSLQGGKVKFVGRFVKISGPLPVGSNTWYYHVEHLRSNLFVYSFWTINLFQDTKEKNYGCYRAKSWTVQVLDSKDEPEKEVIFDRANDFNFWGTFTSKDGKAEIRMNSIKGWPETSNGAVVLNVLK